MASEALRAAAQSVESIPVGLDDVMPSVDSLTTVAHTLDAAVAHAAASAATASGGYLGDFDSHSFWTSLTMIVISELGDKTFLVAALMAMKHDRLLVFSGAFAALALMSVLSALLGHTMPTLLPRWLTQLLACALFVVFGVRMLLEARAMPADASVQDEMREVEHEIEESEEKALRMAEEGDFVHHHSDATDQQSPYGMRDDGDDERRSHSSRTHSSHSHSHGHGLANGNVNGNGSASNGGQNGERRKRPSFVAGSAPLSPDVSIERGDYDFGRDMSTNGVSSAHASATVNGSTTNGAASMADKMRSQFESTLNLCSLVLSPVFVQTFTLTFLGEWGDRSQIATIAMAAGSDYGWVIVGTVLGHGLCTCLAVVGGRLLASKISVRTVTLSGGVLFLVFGAIYALEIAGYELLG